MTGEGRLGLQSCRSCDSSVCVPLACSYLGRELRGALTVDGDADPSCSLGSPLLPSLQSSVFYHGFQPRDFRVHANVKGPGFIVYQATSRTEQAAPSRPPPTLASLAPPGVGGINQLNALPSSPCRERPTGRLIDRTNTPLTSSARTASSSPRRPERRQR